MVALDSDLIDRLEEMANDQGRSMNEVLGELLKPLSQPTRSNWAAVVAEGMEAADIDWIDDPDASANSRKYYKQHLKEKWERSQQSDPE
jgi:hypothetical protein